MDLRKEYSTDKAKTIEGVDMDLGDGGIAKVARLGNPKYEQAFDKYAKPHSKKIRRKTLPEAVKTEITVKAMADGIFIGFSGLKEGGVDLVDTVDERRRILRDYPDLREEILEFSADIENYREESIEDAVGN